jgi:DNA-binding beta-propeller fold protein YncE
VDDFEGPPRRWEDGVQREAIKAPRKIGAVSFAAALLCLIWTSAARAADSVYWVNYAANKISHANLSEGGGGDIPIPAGTLDGPWGLAIDASAGKVYWANENNDTIGYASLDGSGTALLNTAGATIDNPIGLAIDPAPGRIYWTSVQGNKISYANLNGSGGGDLNTTGATVDKPSGLAIDPVLGRVYWTNYGGKRISYANLNGTGGTDLDVGLAPVDSPEGVAIDTAGERIYWTNVDSGTIGYAGLSGGGGGQLDPGGAPVDKPLGLAVDAPAGKVYWANLGNNTIAYASLTGGARGQVETRGATVNGVAFPVLLEAPRGTELPAVQGLHQPGATLSCTQGKWRADLLESFLYLAPQSFSYQWFRNGAPVAGATASSVVASKVGAYSCGVTATNFAGSNGSLSGIDFAINATVGFKKITYNRRKGTAILRVAVTGKGRLDLYGTGVANAQRKHAAGTAKLMVRTSGKARIKLAKTGKARVKATIAYLPEGGKAIKRSKTVVLRKRLRR